ncbi:MAG: nitroreductase family protein [Acidimicrobiia bacterium]
MRLELTPDELLSTTRAVRRRLDFSRPVERDVILECVELAVQAPSASNRQSWQWFFVDDAAVRSALAEIYQRAGERVLSAYRDVTDAQQSRVRASAAYLSEHIAEVPVIMIPLHSGRPQGENQAGYWGSLLPAAWSFCLAARSRGLGTAWTTWHLMEERATAEVLGVPYDDYTQGGLFPVAYTIGTDFKPAARKDLAGLVHWNEW